MTKNISTSQLAGQTLIQTQLQQGFKPAAIAALEPATLGWKYLPNLSFPQTLLTLRLAGRTNLALLHLDFETAQLLK